jgi:hypothetical protein
MEKNNFWAVIEPQDINQGSIISVLSTLKELDKREAEGEEVFRTLTIAFSGFDDTDEELWEIPSVREWAGKLINRVPYLFYYIENDWNHSEQTLMLCLNKFEYKEEAERSSNEEHIISMDIHRESYHAICDELRKFSKERNKEKSMDTVIAQMNNRYGMEA